MAQVADSVPNRARWFDSMLNIGRVYLDACQAEGVVPDPWLSSSIVCAGLSMTHPRLPAKMPTCPARESEARIRVHDRVMAVADDTGTEMHDEQMAVLSAWAGRRH